MIRKFLLPHQGLFIQAPFVFPDRRNFILVAGYGAGKTSSLALLAEFLIKMLQGHKDREGHRPRILLGGVTLGHLEKTTLGYIKQDLDNSHTPYRHDSKNNILQVGDVDVILVALRSPDEIVGFDVWAALLDEVDDLGLSTAEDTTFEAVRAVNERARQIIPGLRKPFLAMASTSQGQKGLYRLYTQYKKSGTGYVLIRGRTADNCYLDKEYVQSLYNIYTERERLVYLEGHFLAISRGQVFGDFDWNRNYLDRSISQEVRSVNPRTGKYEDLYWGQDFNQGYHRGSVWVARNGSLYAVKRYEFPEIREATKVIRHDFPNNKIFFIPDTTAKDIMPAIMKDLQANNIRLTTRGKNPLVEDTAFLVNKLLYTRRMMITEDAKETAEALALEQRDKNGIIPKGVGPTSPIHDTDSVRLVAFFVVCNRREFADIAKVTIGRRLDLEKEIEAEETGVTELKAGFYEIAPSAM